MLLEHRRLLGRRRVHALEAKPLQDLAPLLERQLRLPPHRGHDALFDGSPGTRGRLLRRVRGRAAGLEGRRQGSHGHAGQEVSSVHAAHYTAVNVRAA
jgi:hypothetical protein